MDPYLESRWSDVHGSLLQEIKRVLQRALPDGLRARTEERILLEVDGDSVRAYRGDVAVVETMHSATPVAAAGAARGLASVVVEFAEEPPVETWVQIIDTRDGNRVITAIELLSPGNKAAGRLNRVYQRKVRDYARSRVNLVEIDLLRGSRNRLQVRWSDLPADQRGDYVVCVRRAVATARWECFPFSLRDRAAEISIPLRENDRELSLDLQPLIENAYTDGGHDDIDYRKPLDPPLAANDAAWVDQLLRAAGKRG